MAIAPIDSSPLPKNFVVKNGYVLWRPEDVKAIITALRKLDFVGDDSTILIDRFGTRNVIRAKSVSEGGKATSLLTPFLIEIKSATTVTIRYGQVNNITPTIGGMNLDNNNPPILTVNTTGTRDIYLNCTLDGSQNITAITVETAASTPPSTLSNAYLTLGNVTVDATPKIIGDPNQSVQSSENFLYCSGAWLFGSI